MQPIKSKFSSLFLIKNFTFSTVAIISIILCFSNSINSDGEIYYRAVFQTGIFLSILSIFGLIAILQTFRLTLTDEEIIKLKIFTGKKEIIRYNEIAKIESLKNRLKGKAGYINNGYFSRVITSNSGNSIEISPDEFENYVEIVNFIQSKYIN